VISSVDSLWPVFLIIAGIPLAFYILNRVLGMLPKGR